MKPHEDPEILDIIDPHRRCEKCMDKYPDTGDNICNACPLNPLETKEDMKDFINDAIKNPTHYGIPEKFKHLIPRKDTN